MVIIKALNWIADSINENIENSILNGLFSIAFFLAVIYLTAYVWLYGAFSGHLTRFLVVLGIWIIIELANLIGGGHNERRY